MVHLTGVYITDEVAKDGTRFSVGAMNDMVWQGSDGGVPNHMSHDMQRLVGWNRVKGLYISHEKCSVLGDTMIPETVEEWKHIHSCNNQYIRKIISEGVEKYKDAFTAELESSGLIDKNGLWHYNSVVQYVYEDIVKKAFPDLFAKTNDDGLLFLDDILQEFDYIGQGVFGHKKSQLGVLVHPYFRRSLSELNNYNFGLLDMLFDVYNSGNKSVQIKLATNVVVFTPSWLQAGEYDYWFGPKYNDDINSIKEGCTRHASSEKEKAFNNVDFTDFVWQKKDGEYQFEMEEVMSEETVALGKSMYGCKYMHSFYNFQQGSFRHFDGAIRVYDIDLMEERLSKTMDQMGHRALYIKLFRMDGDIPLHKWKSIVTQFMYGNPLVYEYFGAECPNDSEPTQLPSAPENPITKYIPYPINKGDGVRMMVSYHPYASEAAIRRLATVDEISTSTGKVECVELAAIEVKKALNRIGTDIEMPPDFRFVLTEDYYNNVPMISHGDNGNDANVNQTLEAIKQLIDQHVIHGDEDIYTFCLSWNMDDKNVCLSFMGHVADLKQWLDNCLHIPVSYNEFRTWVELQAKYIREHGRDSQCCVNDKLVRSDGMLYLQHRCIQHDVDIKNIQFTNGCLVAEVEIGKGQEELAAMMNAELTFTPTILIHDVICEDTGSSYLTDCRSSVFGEVTYMIDDESKMEGLVWTDKPCPSLLTMLTVKNS